MDLKSLENKTILILGFGKEGMDTLKFLRKAFPKKVIGVGDRDKNAKCKMQNAKLLKRIRWHLGKNYLKAIKDYDVVIKSPGIPAKILPSQKFRRASQIITSQTEIFFENCPGKIVGITGTKGKSTTTALIYKILKDNGFRAHLVGNIGKPVLNLLFSATPRDVYVYELSSHQLYNLKRSPACTRHSFARLQRSSRFGQEDVGGSNVGRPACNAFGVADAGRPHIAVFLNIYPEHLDYYKNFNEYKNAKTNITRYQKEDNFLIYNSKDKKVSEIAKSSKAKKIPIKGEYYSLDRAAARAVGKIFKIPSQKIEKAIRNFKGLPHRLEYVGTFKGIKFYNDALSTIPETTIAALNFLSSDVETIFLGGFDRGLDFKNLAKETLRSKIKTAILFPTTGKKIWNEILRQAKNKGVPQHFSVDNMPDAVRLSYQYTKKGKICLLSCASPSFSIFKDYKEKGNLFKKYVKLYGKRP